MVVLNTAFADSIVEKVQIAFNNKFNIALEKTPQFSVFDLKDKVNKIAVEIKQRNIQHDRYNEAIIGWNKYIKARSYISGVIPLFLYGIITMVCIVISIMTKSLKDVAMAMELILSIFQ